SLSPASLFPSVGRDRAKKANPCPKLPHLKSMEVCLESTGEQDEDFKSSDAMLADLSLRSAENHGPVRGAAIERYRGGSNEDLIATSPEHILLIGSRFPARFERAVGRHNSVSYVRTPGALSLVPAGVCPLISARSDFEMVACALDFTLVNG